MKKYLFYILLFTGFFATAVYADIVMLNDGTIYLGTVSNTGDNGIILDTFGVRKAFTLGDVFKIEKNFDAVAKQDIEIRLNDDSVLKGNLKDYDDTVGLLLNTNFGTITIPGKGIKEIYDIKRKNNFSGSPLLSGFCFGYYMPFGEFKTVFSENYFFKAFMEFNTNLFRGLYFGVDVAYFMMDYKTDAKVTYYNISSRAYAEYRLLAFRQSASFIKRFVPFILAGTGAMYLSAKDKRSGQTGTKSEVNSTFIAGLGTDFFFSENAGLRIEAGWMSLLQTNLFNSVTFTAGIAYSL